MTDAIEPATPEAEGFPVATARNGHGTGMGKLLFLGLGAAAGAGVALAVYRHPLATALLLHRLKLRAHGLRPHERIAAGTRVSYWMGGAEDSPVAIVFAHGPFSASESWHAVLPRVAKSFRVIAPDLPGFGRSPEPVDQSVAYLGRVLGTLAMEEGVESAIVVGSSLGGLVALEAALSFPGLVRGLVLEGVLGLSGPVGAHLVIHQGRQDVDELLRRAYDTPPRIPAFVREEMVLRSQRPGVDVLLEDVRSAGARLLEAAPGLALPTLILWGDADGLAPVEDGERLNGAIPGSRLVRISRCGHMPHVEAPALFYRELMDFLAGPAPESADAYEI